MRLLLAFTSLFAAAPVAAQVATLEPVKDNTLYQSFNGLFSNGAGSRFFAGATSDNGKRRAVLAFDIAGSVPAGALVTDVTLLLECNAAPQVVTPTAQSLHRLLADWGEGTSNAAGPGGTGAPSTPGDATWRHTFFPDREWLERGGDFAPAPSATTVVGDVGSYHWSSPALAADVQSWLDQPQSNFGWILKDDLELEQSARRYASRESASGAPTLVVHYDGPAIGVAFCAPAAANSTGAPGTLGATGSVSAALNAVALRASDLPPGQFGYLLASLQTGSFPAFGGSQGKLCLDAPLAKFSALAERTGGAGAFSVQVDVLAMPLPGGAVPVQPGETWSFQVWYRDAHPGPTSNFTSGVALTFE